MRILPSCRVVGLRENLHTGFVGIAGIVGIAVYERRGRIEKHTSVDGKCHHRGGTPILLRTAIACRQAVGYIEQYRVAPVDHRIVRHLPNLQIGGIGIGRIDHARGKRYSPISIGKQPIVVGLSYIGTRLSYTLPLDWRYLGRAERVHFG